MVRDPQKELAELLERKQELEESLTKREAELKQLRRNKKLILEQQIRRAQVRVNAKQRKLETRKKILVGACAMDIAAKDPSFARILRHSLDAFLERERDRELFDLPPRPDSDSGG